MSTCSLLISFLLLYYLIVYYPQCIFKNISLFSCKRIWHPGWYHYSERLQTTTVFLLFFISMSSSVNILVRSHSKYCRGLYLNCVYVVFTIGSISVQPIDGRKIDHQGRLIAASRECCYRNLSRGNYVSETSTTFCFQSWRQSQNSHVLPRCAWDEGTFFWTSYKVQMWFNPLVYFFMKG